MNNSTETRYVTIYITSCLRVVYKISYEDNIYKIDVLENADIDSVFLDRDRVYIIKNNRIYDVLPHGEIIDITNHYENDPIILETHSLNPKCDDEEMRFYSIYYKCKDSLVPMKSIELSKFTRLKLDANLPIKHYNMFGCLKVTITNDYHSAPTIEKFNETDYNISIYDSNVVVDNPIQVDFTDEITMRDIMILNKTYGLNQRFTIHVQSFNQLAQFINEYLDDEFSYSFRSAHKFIVESGTILIVCSKQ